MNDLDACLMDVAAAGGVPAPADLEEELVLVAGDMAEMYNDEAGWFDWPEPSWEDKCIIVVE